MLVFSTFEKMLIFVAINVDIQLNGLRHSTARETPSLTGDVLTNGVPLGSSVILTQCLMELILVDQPLL